MKLTRLVFAEGMQWIGTKGALRQAKKFLNNDDLEATERITSLKIPPGELFEEGETVLLNEWIIKDEGAVLIMNDKKFNSTYLLK